MGVKRSFLTLFVVITIIFCLTIGITVGLADAGNFSADSDWGSSDWGSSDYSSDWSSSSWDYSSSDDGDGGVWPIYVTLPTMVIIIIVAIVFGRKKKTRNNTNPNVVNSSQPSRQTSLSLEALKKKDPAFSEAELLDRVGNIYVQMQNAWQAKKWEPMRAVMTDSLYNQFARQLNDLASRHYTNYMERICVMESRITGYTQDESNDVLKVRLTARLVDYTLDESGKLVNGDRKAEKYITYEWTLVRDKNAVTKKQDGMTTVTCPHCGAPVDIAKSAKCEYCGSVITVNASDWVISSIRGIGQRTVR